MGVELAQLALVKVLHFKCLDIVEISKALFLGSRELLRRGLLVKGNIEEPHVGEVQGLQEAKKGYEGDQHRVKCRTEDAEIGIGGHHSLSGKDECTELVEGHTERRCCGHQRLKCTH